MILAMMPDFHEQHAVLDLSRTDVTPGAAFVAMLAVEFDDCHS